MYDFSDEKRAITRPMEGVLEAVVLLTLSGLVFFGVVKALEMAFLVEPILCR